MKTSPSVVEHFDQLSVSGIWSGHYDRDEAASYHFHVRRARVLELLPERLGRVLDVGCGPGVMVEAVLERGGTFEGVDLSPEMVREGRRRFEGNESVSFREADIEALDAEEATYDQVICMGVTEYLTDTDRALREIARVLKPGGGAAITTPKAWHWDRLAVVATAPVRVVGRVLGLGRADRLPRLRLQPEELDRRAGEAGLERAGGSQYCFTPMPYPLTRLLPGLALKVNLPFERWHGSRRTLPSFFAQGYVGYYRKPER